MSEPVESIDHHIQIFVGRSGVLLRAVSPVVPSDARGKLPERARVDLLRSEPYDGAVAVEVGEEDRSIGAVCSVVFFFTLTSSPSTPTNAAIRTVNAVR